MLSGVVVVLANLFLFFLFLFFIEAVRVKLFLFMMGKPLCIMISCHSVCQGECGVSWWGMGGGMFDMLGYGGGI